MVALATQADWELLVGSQNLAQMLDDDGDGVADAATVTAILEYASRIAEGLLLGAFGSASVIATLVAADVALKLSVCEIASDLAARRRPAFLSADGKTPYTGWRDRAEATLREVANAHRRSVGEATAGANQTILTQTNLADRSEFTFAAVDGNEPGPGGF